MTVTAYESSLELEVELASPGPVDPLRPSYPFPPLTRTGRFETRVFGCVCLENEFILATLVPDLGGRLLRVLDKRTGAQVLPPRTLRWHSGGDRLAFLPDGVSLFYDNVGRANESGPTNWAIDNRDEGSAAIWIAETGTGPLSFHLRTELLADSAELLIEARVFNRWPKARHYNGGLSVGALAGHLASGGLVAWNEEEESGLFITSDDLAFASSDPVPTLRRFARLRSMAPRQLDTWTVRLAVVSGIGRFNAAAGPFAVALAADRVAVSLSRPTEESHKLILLTQGGETLESPLGTEVKESLRFPLGPEMSPAVVAILSASRVEVLRAELDSSLEEVPRGELLPPEKLQDFDPLDSFSWLNRAISEARTGVAALGSGAFDIAEEKFEQSLLYNAEDHLVWWLKSVAARLGGLVAEPEEEHPRPELLNAHYLAPLEPALRAEAFLSQPIQGNADPSPLLSELDRTPASFVDVACLLLDAGLYMDASRWLDEALRHCDLAMLRYLLAYTMVTGANLPAEAASHAAAAERLPFGPPFPFRRIEGQALAKLTEMFPHSQQLAEYANLARLSLAEG